MAIYEIIETPGKTKIYPLDGDRPLRNQDEAKIKVNEFRAKAKAEGRKVDFIVRRDTERSVTSSSSGTSIRLTEQNRSMVARFCGRVMMETGNPISMGDAVAMLVKVAGVALDHHLIDFNGEFDSNGIIALAREIRRREKEAS